MSFFLTEREQYVTNQVALWIANDSEHVAEARRAFTLGGATILGNHLRRVVRDAPDHSAPWHVGQELAPNDWGRVDWGTVAEAIAEEP